VTVADAVVGPRTGNPARRLWQVAAALLAGLLLFGLAVAVPGTVDRFDGALHATAPAWTAPCASITPRHDRVLLSRCARVEGRVLYVSREGQPPDTHLAVVARLHLVLVKLRPGDGVPPLGAKISVIGPLVRARNGLRELQAAALERA
jgi:hypothetical protein